MLAKNKKEEKIEEEKYEFYTVDKLDYSQVNLSEEELKKYLEAGYFYKKTI